jgi:protein-histidine pros-kinase
MRSHSDQRQIGTVLQAASDAQGNKLKSALLKRQAVKVFGTDGEDYLISKTNGSAVHQTEIDQSAIGKLLGMVDTSYAAYEGLQMAQRQLSGDIYSDWNLLAGEIKSGQDWQQLLGYLPKELDNKIDTWQRLIRPEHLRLLQASMAKHVMQRSELFEAECQFRTKSGSWQWLLVRGMITARLADGKPGRMLLLQRDIMAIKQADEKCRTAVSAAEEDKTTRSRFIAKVSHEIRTPMNGIIGMTDLVLDTDLDDEQRHYLHAVKSSSSALMAIINDLLDFSKIDAGEMPNSCVELPVRKLIHDAVRALANSAHKKGLELILEIDPNIPDKVAGDASMLRRVLVNLVDNAVKFTDQGEVQVKVTKTAASNSGVNLTFSVSDTGIGIPANRQKAIFDAFTQGDDTVTRSFGGTGLGLAICSRLVQGMGGTLQVTSQSDQGSCFYFTAAFKRLPNTAPIVPPKTHAGKKALLLESNQHASRCLQAALQHLGIEVSLAQSLPEAVAQTQASRQNNVPFDFILANSATTVTPGNKLIKDWQKHGKSERLVWILKCDDQAKELADLRQQGIVAYLVKPVFADHLAAALDLAEKGLETEFVLSPPELKDDLLGAQQGNTDGLNILVVEDNPVSQELILLLLRKHRHRISVANNGLEALALFDNGDFDVVMMDIEMPMMGGIETAEAIRTREMRRSWVMTNEFHNTYIIAVTANVSTGARERCLDAGMNDFIGKPLNPDDLHAALERARANLEGSDFAAGSLQPSDPLADFHAAAEQIGDKEVLHSMASMFLNEWEEHISKLATALAARSGDQLSHQSTNLRALLAMFHATEAQQAVSELVAHAKVVPHPDWSACEASLSAIKVAMHKTRPAFERFVSKPL